MKSVAKKLLQAVWYLHPKGIAMPPKTKAAARTDINLQNSSQRTHFVFIKSKQPADILHSIFTNGENE
jgi:hypothetical protein